MKFWKWYGKLYCRLLFAAAALLVFLAWQLGEAQGREQTPVLLMAELPEGEITAELLAQMEELPGFKKRWLLYEKSCEIRVGRYRAEASVTGVDFSEYPLTVVASAGEKTVGSVPPLVVGDTFFSQLTDENGKAITERQAEILRETFAEQRITLQADAKQNVVSAAASARMAEATGTSGQVSAGESAELLAIVKEEGVYMDASMMRRWLQGKGERPKAAGVMLEIRGEGNAETVREIMEKAGFAMKARFNCHAYDKNV